MTQMVKILRGLPGSGKSTWAKAWATANGGEITSADDFFVRDGVYTFDARFLGRAHEWSWARFVECVNAGLPVAVDNTSTSAKEIERYYLYALEKGCDVEIVEVLSGPETWKRNTHGVPEESIRRMAQRMSNPLPAEWKITRIGPFND